MIKNFLQELSQAFEGKNLFKQNKADDHEKIINIYIVYEMINNGPAGDLYTFGLHNFLFGTNVLKPGKDNKSFYTKNEYSGYGIGFADKSCKHPKVNKSDYCVVALGCDQSQSKYTNNQKVNILVLVNGETEFINLTKIQAEQTYPANFSATNKKFVLSLHYNKSDSYLFVNSI